MCETMVAGGAVVTGVGAVYSVPVVLNSVGFTSAGIRANTVAFEMITSLPVPMVEP